jgi:anti-sigma B factor antagonist
MDVATRWYGDAAVLTICGRLDHDAASILSEQLMHLLQKVDSGAVVIDLSQLEYMSSGGLKSLLMVSRAASGSQHRTILAAPTPLVRELLEMSHAKLVLHILPTLSEAVRMVSAAAAHAYREAHPVANAAPDSE